MSHMPFPPDPDVAMQTYLVHGKAHSEKWDFQHHIVPPMSASATYRLDSTRRGATGFENFASAKAHKHAPIFIYERLDEPTRSMLEEVLAETERGKFAACFATGMAAISTALGVCLASGDHLVCHQTVYGCTYSLLTNWLTRLGITVDFVDLRDLDAVRAAIRPETRVLYTETPVNPTLELVDLAALTALRDQVNAARPSEAAPLRLIIDNTFATPYGQRPLTLGADLVVHSLTKNIGGFGTDMGGAVIAREDTLEGELLVWRKDFGGVMSSRTAWHILVYGLPTLPLRVRRQTETAGVVARWLAQRPEVARVSYPGLDDFPQAALARTQMQSPEGEFVPGTIIYFETVEADAGAHERCDRLVDHIAKEAYAITLAVSLGQLRTLIENPGSMTHAPVPAAQRELGGVTPNGIRLSIGIEDGADIIRDLERAFSATAE